jgi:hypothetical protein
MPNLFDLRYDAIFLNRGKERRKRYRDIIIETLQVLDDQRPTKDELQKLSHIRREKFIVVFRELLEIGVIDRFGSGNKKDPFRYALAFDYSERKAIIPKFI